MDSGPDKPGYFFILIATIAALSGILFGYDTGVVSGAILFIKNDFQLSSLANGIIVSSVLFGALLGAMISGKLVDQLGRKYLLIIDAIIFLLGTLFSSLAYSISLLIAGRISVGIAIGIASYVAPLYISEIAPTKHRGALVSLNQLAVTIGILLSYLVDYYFAIHGGWRYMFLAGTIPAVGLLIGMIFLPESPRFIYGKGKIEQAFLILQQIHGKNSLHELNDIQKNSTQQAGSWKMLFDPFIRKALVIGVGLAVIQQITGINTIIYYAPTIFNMAGYIGPTNAILATSGVGLVFVLSTIVALPLLDTLGRRPLLLVGLLGMTISLSILSFAFSGLYSPSFLKWATLTSMLAYIACFGFSLGPIMWLMIAEIYPLKVRGLGCSLATAVNWGSNMLVALTFLSLIDYVGASHTFLIYSLLSLACLIFIYFFIPETKSVSLEQIEANLRSGEKYRHLGLIKPTWITE